MAVDGYLQLDVIDCHAGRCCMSGPIICMYGCRLLSSAWCHRAVIRCCMSGSSVTIHITPKILTFAWNQRKKILCLGIVLCQKKFCYKEFNDKKN